MSSSLLKATIVQKTKVLVVEDHSYFASELIEFLRDDCNFEVTYAANYLDAVKALRKEKKYDYTILDILLQNGKTGVDIAEKFKDQLGRVIFVTGCADETILNKITDYASASKLAEIWPLLEKFIAGGTPKINTHDTETYRFSTQQSG